MVADYELEVPEWDVEEDVEHLRWSRSLGLWSVAVYLVLFLIRPWEVLIPELAEYRFERVYAIGMLILVALTGRGIRWSCETLCVGLFALAAVASAYFAWQTEYAWPALYQYMTVVVTYFAIVAVSRRLSDILLLIEVYIATMWLYMAKSLWEYFIHDRHDFAQNVSRLLGIELTYGEPNSVAMSVVLSMPFWWLLFRSRARLTTGWGTCWRSAYQWLVLTYPLLALLVVGLTNSRAGMIGVAAFVVGAFYYERGRRNLTGFVLGSLICLALLWLAMPTQQQDRLRTLWDAKAGPASATASAMGRWEGFLAAWTMAQDRPWTGVGIGNFLPYRVALVDGVGLVAHNLPGQILGETGWCGALAFALLAWTIWRRACRLQRAAEDDEAALSQLYARLAWAMKLTLLLLLLFGCSLHNGLRYNWIWLTAFCTLASEFWSRDVPSDGPQVEEEEDDRC